MGIGMLTYMKTIEHQQKSGGTYNRPMDPSWDLVRGFFYHGDRFRPLGGVIPLSTGLFMAYKQGWS